MRQCTRRSASRPVPMLEAIDADRVHDVLELSLAQIDQREVELVPDVVMNRSRDEGLARVRQLLDPRGDVDAVAVEIVAVDNHVLDVDADTDLQALAAADAADLRQPVLYRVGPAHGVDCAAELDEQAVPDHAEQSPAILDDPRFEQVAPEGLPPEHGLDIVQFHEP